MYVGMIENIIHVFMCFARRNKYPGDLKDVWPNTSLRDGPEA